MTAPSPTSTPAPLIVFTDLDGTLLDTRTYSAEPARAALDRLAARGVPVVFCSSKSAAEQRPIRRELGLEHTPFIVENGAAVFVPESAGLPVADWPLASGAAGERVHALGQPFAQVKAGIRRAADRAGIPVTGYAELTVRQIAEVTGLDEAAAARAQRRDFSETLVDQLPPETWAVFEAALAPEGLCARHGGRFRTVTGAETDKGRAVRLLAALFATAAGRSVVTAGLGDSANDAGLLAAVDHAFLLPSDKGGWAPLEVPRMRRLARPGPLGWSDAVNELLG
ncbi:MAG: HAD-IIB family hydrolase [Opitutaceae bacterium]|nr:HAD-IIB family hydrolase [Opitutaceae bacterium]